MADSYNLACFPTLLPDCTYTAGMLHTPVPATKPAVPALAVGLRFLLLLLTGSLTSPPHSSSSSSSLNNDAARSCCCCCGVCAGLTIYKYRGEKVTNYIYYFRHGNNKIPDTPQDDKLTILTAFQYKERSSVAWAVTCFSCSYYSTRQPPQH